MLGFKPKLKEYSHTVVEYHLPIDGKIQYAQWLHPAESTKLVRQDEMAIDIGAHTGDTALPMALAN